jgi:Zn-dependent M28 family amino/carboxypeptidase
MAGKPLWLVAIVALAMSVYLQQPATDHFTGKTWWDHVKVLADNRMEGRETGSEGERQAAGYVIDRLKKAGIQPAGTDGYRQPVQFVSRQIVEKESSVALVREAAVEPLTLGEDAFFGTRVELPPQEVNAFLVFVGYGLKIPEKNYNDLADLDLKGKVVVVFSGSKADIPTNLASHYQTALERWKALRQAGAVGIIAIPNPASMDVPWARMSLNRTHAQMDLADPEFNETAGQKLALIFNPAKAEKLFAGSGHTFQEIANLGKDRQSLPHFPLPVSIRARARIQTQEVKSANIIAKLPGTDSHLSDQYVALSAHIDHIGIGEPINGDRIYNGAMDNASGVAVLLDVAASLKQSGEKLRRSVLFVFPTAEEKGLLGSKYFTAHPSVDPKSIVADINVDMFLPIVPFRVLRVLGLEESDLGDWAREVAQARKVRALPDPEPLRNVFIRSDQYSFVRHGIPSVFLSVGFPAGSPEQKIFKNWLTQRYHAPSDDLNQPVDLAAAAQFEELYRDLLIRVANDAKEPQWKPDSFFRRYATQKQ